MRSGIRYGIPAAFLCLVLFLTAPARSQLIITMHNVQGAMGVGKASITSKTPDNETMNVFIGKPSMNPQEWDFSGLPFSRYATNEYVNVTEAPFPSLFQDANVVRKTERSGQADPLFQYYRLTNESFALLGTCFENDTSATLFSPCVCQIRFPCALGTSWSYESDPEHPAQGVTLITRHYCVVDAKGTMKLVEGEYPALRLRRETVTEVTTPTGSTMNRFYTFTWLTAEMISVGLVMDTTQEAYSVIDVSDVFLEIPTQTSRVERLDGGLPRQTSIGSVYPNPARRSDLVRVRFDLPAPGMAALEMFDALGRKIVVRPDGFLDAGSYVARLTVRRLASGIYFVVLRSERAVVTDRLIVIE